MTDELTNQAAEFYDTSPEEITWPNAIGLKKQGAESSGKSPEEQASLSGLGLLRQPFPAHQISKLPRPMAKKEEMDKLPKARCDLCGGYHATSKIVHLDYVGHAALTDRLLDADPNWNWEPLAFTEAGLPAFDNTGGLWIKLTVCGQTRLGYGHAESSTYKEIGAREKEVIGDALRNAAMRFGAALYLWHKGDLHVEDDAASGNGSIQISPETKEDIIALIQETNSDTKKALAAVYGPDGPKSLDELTTRGPWPYGALINKLKDKKAILAKKAAEGAEPQ